MDENEVVVEEKPAKKTTKKKAVFTDIHLGDSRPEMMEYKRNLFMIYGVFTKLNNEYDIVTYAYTKRAQEQLKLPINGVIDEATFTAVKGMAGGLM